MPKQGQKRRSQYCHFHIGVCPTNQNKLSEVTPSTILRTGNGRYQRPCFTLLIVLWSVIMSVSGRHAFQLLSRPGIVSYGSSCRQRLSLPISCTSNRVAGRGWTIVWSLRYFAIISHSEHVVTNINSEDILLSTTRTTMLRDPGHYFFSLDDRW